MTLHRPASQLFFAVCFVLWAIAPLIADELPEIELIGTASIPGDATDLSGDAAVLENGEPRNRLGGFSALDYSGTGNVFAAMSDRGPDDGAVGYPCRVQMLEITICPGQSVPVTTEVIQTVMFRDAMNRQFPGSSAVIEATNKLAHRFDPEGFRFGPKGTMFVSDEYGPVLIEFNNAGQDQRRYPLPRHLLVSHPAADKNVENNSNQKGRASNRGMECLALSTDGKSLVGLMQSGLIQDSKKDDDGRMLGRNCRLVKVDLESGHTSEFVYQMDSAENGNSEILACGPDQYLVLERDSRAGEKAAYRKLIQIDLSVSTEISAIESLPHQDLPEKIKPASRTVFLDFLDPRWRLAGDSMPEKIEGLSFGPTLADGRRTLLVGTDNDFESANASQIWVFAIAL